jgi:hypothetical protein
MMHSQEDDALRPALVAAVRKTDADGGPGAPSKGSHLCDDRIENLLRILKVLMDNKFTGYIKLNFTQGTLGRVEKFEEILKK